MLSLYGVRPSSSKATGPISDSEIAEACKQYLRYVIEITKNDGNAVQTQEER